LERFEKKLEAISKMVRDTADDQYDFKADLHELIQAIAHFLDRLMDAVWQRYGKPAAGKKKPNVYFPDCDCEAAFLRKLKSLQLETLEHDAPLIYSGIRDVQPGFGSKGDWLRTLKTLANLKHERHLNIEEMRANSLAIGVNQNLYIKELTLRDGRVDFQGQAFNQQTGALEPVKIQFSEKVHEILELAKCDPIHFVGDAIGHARSLAVLVFANAQHQRV
jgi:hypothetical protein